MYVKEIIDYLCNPRFLQSNQVFDNKTYFGIQYMAKSLKKAGGMNYSTMNCIKKYLVSLSMAIFYT